MTTKENVLLIAPGLSTADDDLWNLILNDVNNFISTSVFGTKTEIAARNWVAHRMTLAINNELGNVSGSLTKVKVGDVMYEYAKIKQVAKSDMDYGRTQYGREFLTIRNSCIPYFGVVIPGV